MLLIRKFCFFFRDNILWPSRGPIRLCGRKSIFFEFTRLGAFTTNAAGQLDVLWHDGDTLGVDGTQVGIFEKTNQVGLGSLLKSHNGRGLETEVSFEVLSNLTYKSLERQLADEQLGALLVPTDLKESNGSRPVSVWLFDSSCCSCQLPCSLGCQLFAWGLATSRFASGLLCTSHCVSYTRQRCSKSKFQFFAFLFPYSAARVSCAVVGRPFAASGA